MSTGIYNSSKNCGILKDTAAIYTTRDDVTLTVDDFIKNNMKCRRFIYHKGRGDGEMGNKYQLSFVVLFSGDESVDSRQFKPNTHGAAQLLEQIKMRWLSFATPIIEFSSTCGITKRIPGVTTERSHFSFF